MAVEPVIILEGMGLALTDIIKDDKTASEADIKPGMMLDLGTDKKTVKKHASAAAAKVGLYALDSPEWNQGIDDVYKSGDNVKYIRHVSGLVLNLILCASVTGTEGLAVVSNGDGTVKLNTGSALDAVVGYIHGETVVTAGGQTKRVAVRLA